MIIIGVDYHPSFQQIAFMDKETGECKEQHLDGAQICARFEEARGKAVAQRVRMHTVRETGPPGGSFEGMVDYLGSDGAITGTTMIAREQLYARLSPQPVPVSSKFFEQLWAEQHIAVLAAFTALDVNHHALTVDIADFQAREFGTPESGGVEGHQQSAMQGRASRIDESRDFFLAEDRWQMNGLLRVGCFRDAPGFLECLDVKKA